MMKKSFAAALPLAFPVVVTLLTGSIPVPQNSRPAPLRIEYSALDQGTAALPEHSIVLTVEERDTLDSVLVEGGLDRSQSAAINRDFGRFIDLRRLRPGHLLRFHYSNGSVDSVQMKVLGWGAIDAVRDTTGFQVTGRPAPTRTVNATIAADIDSSLYETLRGLGESPQIVQQLVDVFQWDIDFFTLRRGDSFSMVVEKRYAGDELVGYGPITAARFTQNGQQFEAFRQETPNGRAGYYTRLGNPLRKQFLRAPLQFTRITSGFSKSRFHPILHYFRPHHGVDYGAPTGTPVMTTADGVVLETAYKRGEGNFVRVRHTSRIETYYLHLSRFASGVRPGRKLMQGDVIGYVGATGLATAPHLDYRVRDSGTWLDPLRLKSITPDPLRGSVIAEFRAKVARLAPRLSTATQQVAETAHKRRALF
jgi:murein DD-endopeptidase MepM/ murein hydrolase activator NlpD